MRQRAFPSSLLDGGGGWGGEAGGAVSWRESQQIKSLEVKMISPSLVVLVVAVLVTTTPTVGEEVHDMEGVDAGGVVEQMLGQQEHGCHLVVITTAQHSSVFSSIVRHVSDGGQASLLVEADVLFRQHQSSQNQLTLNQSARNQLAQDQLLQGMWGDLKTTCRTVIVDGTINHTSHALRLLEMARLWQRPMTGVVVVGEEARGKTILLHPSLRNALHALYLALEDLDLHTQPWKNISLVKSAGKGGGRRRGVSVYKRCMYCRRGDAGVRLFHRWNSNASIYELPHDLLVHNKLEDLMGYKMKILTMRFFPYVDYEKDTEEPGTTVTLKDSLSSRMLDILSASLNFTYEIREQRENVWGLVQENGSFSGLVGNLEREETDCSTLMGPSPKRIKVIGFTRAYPSDQLIVISLKPTLLPQHLAIVRPFTGDLWAGLLGMVVIWCLVLWLLHRASRWTFNWHPLGFTSSLMFGWGALLDTVPPNPSVSVSNRVLIGWWLIFSLVISAAYKSSLIAHLSVQGRTKPLENMRQLVEEEGWQWSIESWLLSGRLNVEEALQKVMGGKFGHIIFRNYMNVILAAHHTDARGHTPFYVGKEGLSIFASFGWGF
ncbi:Glutamate receptor-like 41, partial [Homarus americanus]